MAISFVLAVTLWFLVTLNTKTFSTYISYPVRLLNVPDQFQLLQPFPQYLQVKTEGLGIKLLNQIITSGKDTIKVDFLRFSGSETFIPSENLGVINAALPEGLEALEALPNSISLKYVPKTTRKLPVRLASKIPLPPTYRHVSKIKLKPDSVLVIGPEEVLAKKEFWDTENLDIEPVTRPRQIKVRLDTVDMKPLQLIDKFVTVSVNPEPYTEKEVEVRVQSFASISARIRLTPEKVKVKILVPQKEYAQIDSSDFTIEVNLEKINRRSPMVIPEITGVPEKVEIVSIKPDRLKYMIIR